MNDVLNLLSGLHAKGIAIIISIYAVDFNAVQLELCLCLTGIAWHVSHVCIYNIAYLYRLQQSEQINNCMMLNETVRRLIDYKINNY